MNIYLYKYFGVVISGALAGLGGAFIASPELSGIYLEGQTNGRGFIASRKEIQERPWVTSGCRAFFWRAFCCCRPPRLLARHRLTGPMDRHRRKRRPRSC